MIAAQDINELITNLVKSGIPNNQAVMAGLALEFAAHHQDFSDRVGTFGVEQLSCFVQTLAKESC